MDHKLTDIDILFTLCFYQGINPFDIKAKVFFPGEVQGSEEPYGMVIGKTIFSKKMTFKGHGEKVFKHLMENFGNEKVRTFLQFFFQTGIQTGANNILYFSLHDMEIVLDECADDCFLAFDKELDEETTSMLNSLKTICDEKEFAYISESIIQGLYQFGLMQMWSIAQKHPLPRIDDSILLSYANTNSSMAIGITVITHDGNRYPSIISRVVQTNSKNNVIVYGCTLELLKIMTRAGGIKDMLEKLLAVEDIPALSIKQYVLPNDMEREALQQFISDNSWHFNKRNVALEGTDQLSLFPET